MLGTGGKGIEQTIEDSLLGAVHWVEHNRKPFFIGLGVFLLVLVAAFSWPFWQRKQADRIRELHHEVRLLEEDLFKPSEAIAFAPLNVENYDPKKVEKIDAAYRQAVEKYGKTKVGRFMHFDYASFLVKTKQYEPALTHYRAFLDTFAGNSPYRGLVLMAMAHCAEQKESLEEAEKYLLEANQLEETPQKEFVLLRLAGVREKLGKKEEAAGHYQEILDDFARSPVANLARERRFALGFGPEVTPKKDEKETAGL